MSAATLKYVDLQGGGRIASVTLNRPEAANSFNGELLVELTGLFRKVRDQADVRLLLLQGAGKHFSAGADLNWMKAAAALDHAGNLKESTKLLDMFESLATLEIPTVAVVHGAAFGGGVGLIAACDYAIATETAKICLSEVKIGLIPAVIAPYLARKMHAGSLMRLALSGRIFSGVEAREAGLVTVTTMEQELPQVLEREVSALLEASPEAQRAYKRLQKNLEKNFPQSNDTVEAIAALRVSASGQEGLAAFFAQTKAPWVKSLPAATTLRP